MAGARITVAIAITRNPPPCEPPVNFCDGPLKLWMSCWNGAYRPPRGSGPRCRWRCPQVDDPEAHARSRTKWRVPWVRLASHGRAEEADPQAEQGGDDVPLGRDAAAAIAAICAASCRPVAGDVAEDHGADLADQEADEGVESQQPGLALRPGGPRAVEERHVAPVGPARWRRRSVRSAAGGGGQARDPGSRRAASGAGGGGGGGGLAPAGRHSRGTNRPGRARGAAGPVPGPPRRVGVGHRQDVTGARSGPDLQGQ